MNLEKTVENLKRRGFGVRCFPNRAAAADYLAESIRDTAVGIGGSTTIQQLDVANRLKEHNRVLWHWLDGNSPETARAATAAPVYLCSANAVAETGEILNIDGRGNRVAATLYDKKKVYIVIGTNKIAENFDAALWRARNVASPLNAKRLNKKTPCALLGKCADCAAPERICGCLVVHWSRPAGVEELEVVIVEEELGF